MLRRLAIPAVVAALAVAAPPASAYPPWVFVVRDCAFDGKLDGTYRHQDLEEALHNVPSDGGEYTDCANAIHKALDGGTGKTTAPPPNGIVTESGAIAASQDDVAALQTIVAAAGSDEPTAAEPRAEPATVAQAPDSEAVLGGLDSSSRVHYPVTALFGAAFLVVLLALVGGRGAGDPARPRPY